MSKASEWAERYRAVKESRPAPYLAPPSSLESRQCYAGVTDDGGCKLVPANVPLDPDIACAVAAWILDTFGETPS